MSYVPGQGDIVYLNFDPSAGKEIMKRRPAIVVSRKVFNDHTGFAVVAPITSKKRNIKLEIEMPDDYQIQGAILAHQIKSVDFKAREIEFVECCSIDLIKKLSDMVKLIVT